MPEAPPRPTTPGSSERPVEPNEPAAGAPAEPRSRLERAADEVASWFGDADAAGRRQRDSAAGDHTGQGPAVKVGTDEQIRDELIHQLTADPRLDASKVKVAVLAGAVTLEGSVTTGAERSRAEDVAVAIPGVSQVNNRLLVA